MNDLAYSWIKTTCASVLIIGLIATAATWGMDHLVLDTAPVMSLSNSSCAMKGGGGGGLVKMNYLDETLRGETYLGHFYHVKPEILWAISPSFGKNTIGATYDLLPVKHKSLVIFLRQLPRSASIYQPGTWSNFNELLDIPLKYPVTLLTHFAIVQADTSRLDSAPQRNATTYSVDQNKTRSELRNAIQRQSCDEGYGCNEYIRLMFSGASHVTLSSRFFAFVDYIEIMQQQVAVLNESYFDCLDRKLFAECCQNCVSSQIGLCSMCLDITRMDPNEFIR